MFVLDIPVDDDHPVQMALAGLGLFVIVATVAAWSYVARGLKSAGQPSDQAWRYLASSWCLWTGVVMVVASFSPPAASVLTGVLFLALTVQVVRGLRDFPRVWRLIGEPEAWKGKNPY